MKVFLLRYKRLVGERVEKSGEEFDDKFGTFIIQGSAYITCPTQLYDTEK